LGAHGKQLLVLWAPLLNLENTEAIRLLKELSRAAEILTHADGKDVEVLEFAKELFNANI
jgi:hypothetical protein